jgi:hypothetical protein
MIPNLNLGHPTFCVEDGFCFGAVDMYLLNKTTFAIEPKVPTLIEP